MGGYIIDDGAWVVDMAKCAGAVAKIVYWVGVVCVVVLGVVSVFGSEELPYPGAMVSLRFSALVWLIVGRHPMVLACIGFWVFSDVKRSKHRLRNSALVFAPAFVCYGCFVVFVLGPLVINRFR